MATPHKILYTIKDFNEFIIDLKLTPKGQRRISSKEASTSSSEISLSEGSKGSKGIYSTGNPPKKDLTSLADFLKEAYSIEWDIKSFHDNKLYNCFINRIIECVSREFLGTIIRTHLKKQPDAEITEEEEKKFISEYFGYDKIYSDIIEKIMYELEFMKNIECYNSIVKIIDETIAYIDIINLGDEINEIKSRDKIIDYLNECGIKQEKIENRVDELIAYLNTQNKMKENFTNFPYYNKQRDLLINAKRLIEIIPESIINNNIAKSIFSVYSELQDKISIDEPLTNIFSRKLSSYLVLNDKINLYEILRNIKQHLVITLSETEPQIREITNIINQTILFLELLKIILFTSPSNTARSDYFKKNKDYLTEDDIDNIKKKKRRILNLTQYDMDNYISILRQIITECDNFILKEEEPHPSSIVITDEIRKKIAEHITKAFKSDFSINYILYHTSGEKLLTVMGNVFKNKIMPYEELIPENGNTDVLAKISEYLNETLNNNNLDVQNKIDRIYHIVNETMQLLGTIIRYVNDTVPAPYQPLLEYVNIKIGDKPRLTEFPEGQDRIKKFSSSSEYKDFFEKSEQQLPLLEEFVAYLNELKGESVSLETINEAVEALPIDNKAKGEILLSVERLETIFEEDEEHEYDLSNMPAYETERQSLTNPGYIQRPLQIEENPAYSGSEESIYRSSSIEDPYSHIPPKRNDPNPVGAEKIYNTLESAHNTAKVILNEAYTAVVLHQQEHEQLSPQSRQQSINAVYASVKKGLTQKLKESVQICLESLITEIQFLLRLVNKNHQTNSTIHHNTAYNADTFLTNIGSSTDDATATTFYFNKRDEILNKIQTGKKDESISLLFDLINSFRILYGLKYKKCVSLKNLKKAIKSESFNIDANEPMEINVKTKDSRPLITPIILKCILSFRNAIIFIKMDVDANLKEELRIKARELIELIRCDFFYVIHNVIHNIKNNTDKVNNLMVDIKPFITAIENKLADQTAPEGQLEGYLNYLKSDAFIAHLYHLIDKDDDKLSKFTDIIGKVSKLISVFSPSIFAYTEFKEFKEKDCNPKTGLTIGFFTRRKTKLTKFDVKKGEIQSSINSILKNIIEKFMAFTTSEKKLAETANNLVNTMVDTANIPPNVSDGITSLMHNDPNASANLNTTIQNIPNDKERESAESVADSALIVHNAQKLGSENGMHHHHLINMSNQTGMALSNPMYFLKPPSPYEYTHSILNEDQTLIEDIKCALLFVLDNVMINIESNTDEKIVMLNNAILEFSRDTAVKSGVSSPSLVDILKYLISPQFIDGLKVIKDNNIFCTKILKLYEIIIYSTFEDGCFTYKFIKKYNNCEPESNFTLVKNANDIAPITENINHIIQKITTYFDDKGEEKEALEDINIKKATYLSSLPSSTRVSGRLTREALEKTLQTGLLSEGLSHIALRKSHITPPSSKREFKPAHRPRSHTSKTIVKSTSSFTSESSSTGSSEESESYSGFPNVSSSESSSVIKSRKSSPPLLLPRRKHLSVPAKSTKPKITSKKASNINTIKDKIINNLFQTKKVGDYSINIYKNSNNTDKLRNSLKNLKTRTVRLKGKNKVELRKLLEHLDVNSDDYDQFNKIKRKKAKYEVLEALEYL